MLVHGGLSIHRDNAFRCRGSIAKGTVWSDRVVVLAPLLDNNAGFLEGVEDLAIEQFVPEAGIEALAVSVLPR
jgi:hypothetical protein